MVSYTALASVASQLLTSFGDDAVFSRTSGESYSVTTGKYSGGTPVSFTAKGARFDYNLQEINGQTILRDDVKLVVDTENGTPQVDDSCVFDSITYRVMSVTALSPNGTDLYYELQLRH